MAGNGLGDFVAAAMARRPGSAERVSTVVLVGDEGRAVREAAGGEEGVVRLTPALLGALPQDLDWVRAVYAAPVELVLVDQELPTAAVLDMLAGLRRELGDPVVEVVSVGGPFRCSCGSAVRLLPPGPAGDAVQALFAPLRHFTVCLVGCGSAGDYWAFVSGLTSAEGTRIEEDVAREFGTCVVHDCSDALALVCAGALGFEGDVATFPDGEIVPVDRSAASVVRFAAADEPLALVPHECAAEPAPGRPYRGGTGDRPDAVTWRRLAQTMGLTGPRAVEQAVDKMLASGAEPVAFPVHRV
ncbi:hypothetical protein ABT075_34530 [Streptomyces sp. NPDC002677]|uniref:hypothetical protein n=1 Tax=Streptomyces sp. NPDC002677 TaxID=3154774 RepID=UPI00332720FE